MTLSKTTVWDRTSRERNQTASTESSGVSHSRSQEAMVSTDDEALGSEALVGLRNPVGV